MQGDGAAESIINALLTINNRESEFDLVVVIRGGGSQIDLDCFDNYDLAAHIAQFPLPVLTGIGHERDETIVDLVAHTKLKTPTAVAEFLIGRSLAFEDKIDLYFSRLYQQMNQIIKEQNQLLLTKEHQIKAIYGNVIFQEANRVTNLKDKLKNQVSRVLQEEKHQIEIKEQALDLLNPENAFKRGYTLTTARGIPITNQDIKIGDVLETYGSRIKLTSSVLEVNKRDD